MPAQSALCVTDICRYICFYVKKNRQYRKTLNSLARCSRAFSDAALDALWEQIDSLEPLLKLILSSTLEHGGGQSDYDALVLTRQLQPAELNRISFYSRRVRALTYDHHRHIPCNTVIGQLANYPETNPLLPRLKSLTYRHNSRSTVPHMISNLDTFLAICPSFQKLTVQDDSPHRTRRGDQAYFDILPKKLPHVRDFGIITDLHLPKLCFTAQFEHLRSLEIGVANQYKRQAPCLEADSLQTIAGLRNLESLSIKTLRILSWPPVPSLAGFPSLRGLRIVQGDHEGVYALLSHMKSPFLVEIDVALKPQQYDWIRDIAPCFTLISTRFRTSLESLTWRAEEAGDYRSDPQEVRELKTHLLRPLLDLHRLKHLDLQISTNLLTTEWLRYSLQEAEEMSRAWTNLESFSFSANFSFFSLASLVSSVLGCRHLIYVEIPLLFIDGYEIEMTSGISSVNDPPRFLELKARWVKADSQSPSPHRQPLPACLHQLFPRLHIL
ncbi:hypothetical protein JAAARDRAFT_198238 [Jaapia argillacea MUCL 33604]|uniref:F-box domain-containing protein n=1 Tax=Jaapia argillacea MUCL 33604 TaxID=933084 RepID=A0A067PFK2_9AGAM|nr:hypothetical protein JAAARDRAFT_198238 [Jaapia argillacea MUCL 33604]